ncbi:dienelactone hydrolase [Sphingomonas japonica]|uniref:Dienelactone hydrolase n=1 Tax=Sphingomonas japonica TaxID=511662 RepID=A0ABX0U110_9SPHN|nr:dienelactone hydrolase [Sphingomonas japonica]NIJ22991.1 dienelactone hydrolase [Sphingomonas japonica]
MRYLMALALLLFAPSAHAQAGFAFANAPGPHGVGLRVVEQYDLSRSYRGANDPVTGEAVAGVKARPIQTLIWYPATKGGTPLRYSDYLRLSATEEVFGRSDAEIAAATAAFLRSAGPALSPDRIKAETGRTMWAVRDAASAPGKFPVVIYAPSFGAPAYENADLAEYLASQGYVVIASPSMGARSRSMTFDVEGISAQAGDIGFLIAFAHSLPQADLDHLAVAGFSWGGLSNVFAAAVDSRIDALVSLDGSVRYFPGLVESAKYVTPARVTAPFLFVAAKPQAIEELQLAGLDSSASFLNKLTYSDFHRVTMNQMVHGNMASRQVAFSPDTNFSDFSRSEVEQSYGWSARYVLRFLDAYLKADATGAAFLAADPESNGVPRHLLEVTSRKSTGVPPTREALAAQLAVRGFDAIPEVYAEMRTRDASFELSEEDLNIWGYQLLERGDDKAAIAVLKLATTLYPKSFNAFDSLGEAYQSDGNKQLAIANYRKSLDLNPGNQNAAERIKAMQGKP